MKRGGRIIYFGPLGHHSDQLVEYFEVGPACGPSPGYHQPVAAIAQWLAARRGV